MSPKKPYKAAKDKKSSYLRVRVTADDKALFERVAEHAGVGFSSWARLHLLPIARKEDARKG